MNKPQMRILKILFICVFLVPTNSYAQKQDKNSDAIEKNSVSINFLGSASLLGVTYERILSENFIFEVGVGYVGLGLGTTYYPFHIKKSKLCPYTGIKSSLVVLPGVSGAYGAYVPVGLTYFSQHRYNIGLDFGPALGHWVKSGGGPAIVDPTINRNDSGRINVYGNLKIGFRL